ncbi:hypothetical protein GF340_01590 [Candidatus Peregrinibacteria bacterium]|nr:hypothetical protein [Candidatus Peregrinibacteria bacterium]
MTKKISPYREAGEIVTDADTNVQQFIPSYEELVAEELLKEKIREGYEAMTGEGSYGLYLKYELQGIIDPILGKDIPFEEKYTKIQDALKQKIPSIFDELGARLSRGLKSFGFGSATYLGLIAVLEWYFEMDIQGLYAIAPLVPFLIVYDKYLTPFKTPDENTRGLMKSKLQLKGSVEEYYASNDFQIALAQIDTFLRITDIKIPALIIQEKRELEVRLFKLEQLIKAKKNKVLNLRIDNKTRETEEIRSLKVNILEMENEQKALEENAERLNKLHDDIQANRQAVLSAKEDQIQPHDEALTEKIRSTVESINNCLANTVLKPT